MAQILAGGVCLCGAWFFGHYSSQRSGMDGTLARPELRSEDLVWNETPLPPPPLRTGQAGELGAAQDPTAGAPESGTGPMIVEPDFSQLETRLAAGPNGSGPSLSAVDRGTGVSSEVPALRPVAPDGQGLRTLDQPLSVPPEDRITRSGESAVGGNFQVLKPAPLPDVSLLDRTGVAGPGALAPVVYDRETTLSGDAGSFRMHLVRPGETLQSLSRHYFGEPDYYLDIYALNQDVLTSPAAVRAGLTLRIPGGQPDR